MSLQGDGVGAGAKNREKGDRRQGSVSRQAKETRLTGSEGGGIATPMIEQLPEVQKLSPREKRALAIELWSEAEFEPAEVDPEVVALLNERWECYQRGDMPARSWKEIRSEISNP